MIDLLHDTFGGSKKIKSRQSHSKKIQYVWCVRGRESCKSVIDSLYPYLILKKDQAKHLLNFIIECKETMNMHLKMQSLNNSCLVNSDSIVKQAKKNTESEIFWSYFAGILDTEGSFSIRKNKPSWGCISYKYNPVIQLCMASFPTMNHIRKNMCYGSVCFPKAKTTQRGFVYKMAIGKIDECIDTINRIIPYLKFKVESAKELRNFCLNYTRINHKQNGIPVDELEFRENSYQRLKQLNSGEIYKPSLIDSEARWGDEAQA
jgi:hypothetical protein